MWDAKSTCAFCSVQKLQVGEIMVDFYDDRAIDYFEDEDELDTSDAAFMRGYLEA